MSMIGRYKKAGGFLQLLNLIETCGPQKQEKFLKMIEDEDPRWAEAIRTKMISVRKIFTWSDNTVAEITARLNDLTLAMALHGLEAELHEKAFKMMAHSRRKKIEDLMAEKKPTPAEISTTFMQILTEVRGMVDHGYIYLEKIDPSLVVESDIEEKLTTSTLFSLEHEPAAPKQDFGSVDVKHAAPAGHAANNTENLDLKRRLTQLANENAQLKEKLHQAEAKLAQIRRIA